VVRMPGGFSTVTNFLQDGKMVVSITTRRKYRVFAFIY